MKQRAGLNLEQLFMFTLLPKRIAHIIGDIASAQAAAASEQADPRMKTENSEVAPSFYRNIAPTWSSLPQEFMFKLQKLFLTGFLRKLMKLGKADAGETIMERSATLVQILIEGIDNEELGWKILADS
ncbi:conserved hypothetical protein [Ricinus communis]|uniref:Uncharacterized protein n=1 Tax=Ricinus communis TaxID=3988 RepID=B9RXR4_RICCO|nr:conserved hypothetical protein [Ricinus communis]